MVSDESQKELVVEKLEQSLGKCTLNYWICRLPHCLKQLKLDQNVLGCPLQFTAYHFDRRIRPWGIRKRKTMQCFYLLVLRLYSLVQKGALLV